jgi:glycosyltransferase involved in cell wall biosynthesis
MSMKNKKSTDGYKFSIVIPSYNQAIFIERSLLSIITQEHKSVEIIIIDGGSKDGTIDIIQKYSEFIHYWVSERDEGQSDALNKGFSIATGDVFGWLNSDDTYSAEAFSIAERILKEHPEKNVVYGDWMQIDASDNIISRCYAFDFDLKHLKYEGFQANAQAMFWRREAHHRFGYFDKNLRRTMDYQLMVGLGINEGKRSWVRTHSVLGSFRRHENQKTKGADAEVLNEHKLIAKNYGFDDKYSYIGNIKRVFFRVRRAYWYIRRAGLMYAVAKIRSKFSRLFH